MSDRITLPHNQQRLDKRTLKARIASDSNTHTTAISAESIARYLMPYERWERDLVRLLDRQRRSSVLYAGDEVMGLKSGECHHNVKWYCSGYCRASHVLGWLDDGYGYALHSVVQVENERLEVTLPLISLALPSPILPFVRDDALSLAWQERLNGRTRAIITRERKEMPQCLRTPKAAREFGEWAKLQQPKV